MALEPNISPGVFPCPCCGTPLSIPANDAATVACPECGLKDIRPSENIEQFPASEDAPTFELAQPPVLTEWMPVSRIPRSVTRFERESRKRLRELERQAKEQAKLSALEQARLEVQTYDSQIEVLLSAHKESSPRVDWHSIRATLLPFPPVKSSYHEHRAKQRIAISTAAQHDDAETILAEARRQDEEAYRQAVRQHEAERANVGRLARLAERILAGDTAAYKETLAEFNPFSELWAMGSRLRFSTPSKQLLACVLKVKGTEAIPSEVKTLTASGKLSVKQMPRARFHELYQDCVCSYMLRVAREVFALLPVDTLLITACTDLIDAATGQLSEQAVLSSIMPRAKVADLNFEVLDPSDAIESFTHRGNFKASRKAGAFMPIVPLTPADIADTTGNPVNISEILAKAKELHTELQTLNASLAEERAVL